MKWWRRLFGKPPRDLMAEYMAQVEVNRQAESVPGLDVIRSDHWAYGKIAAGSITANKIEAGSLTTGIIRAHKEP